MDYTVHGILQARILEWVAVPFSSGSSQPGDQTQVSCIAGGFFTADHWERPHDCIVGVRVSQAQILFIYLIFSKVALQLKRQMGESRCEDDHLWRYRSTDSGRLVGPVVSSLLLGPPKNSPVWVLWDLLWAGVLPPFSRSEILLVSCQPVFSFGETGSGWGLSIPVPGRGWQFRSSTFPHDRQKN